MWKRSFQQVGKKLLDVRSILSRLDVGTKTTCHLVHLDQTEHVRQYCGMHHQTCQQQRLLLYHIVKSANNATQPVLILTAPAGQ